MSSNLPALIVVLPLLGGLLAPFVGRGWRPWIVVTGVTWTVFLFAVTVLRRVLTHGPVEHAFGGWEAPWGIAYRVDLLNAFVLTVIAGIGAVVALAGHTVSDSDLSPRQVGLMHSLYLLCFAGLLGVVITGDAFNLYVLLEIASLASYALVALGRDRRARKAAFGYLIMGSIGATLILLGVGYLYLLTGTLNMADLSERLAGMTDSRVLRAAYAFLIAGIALKAALFPLHGWLPGAYRHSPTMVSAFLSGTATKVALYVLVRFTYDILGPETCFELLPGRPLLLAMACTGIVVASFVAFRQEDLKSLLAWSSVAQVGYIVVGIALLNVTALTGALVHVLNHSVMKGGMFLALGAIETSTGRLDREGLRGAGRRHPWAAAALTLGGLGLVGLPLTAGFVSKWYLVGGALEAGLWPVALVMVTGSLIAAGYAWRIIEPLYSTEPADGASDWSTAPASLVAPAWLLVGASIAFGITTTHSVGIVGRAAAALL